MFDGLYPEAADTALTAKLNRKPDPEPTQRFSTWGLFSAAPKGVAAGAAQGAASAADLGKAIADKVPANVTGPLGHIPIMNLAMSVMQVGADIARGPKEGQFTSEVGTSLRNVAQDYTPDPVTTHVAESAVFNLFRMGSKAMTAAVTMGNIPGAVVAGTEEAFSQSDAMARQGVDVATRTKAAQVNAVINSAGFALPVAGKTWMQTGALALVGGPASFMAQNAATREILQAADYSKLADQYDPFDPVGLALSTVLPLGFGALAMRGAKVKGKAPDVPTMHPPEDVVDAARVSLIRQHMDSTNPVPNDMGAADAHVKAYSAAMEQMAAGERVNVAGTLPEHVLAQVSDAAAARMTDVGKAPGDVPPMADFMSERGMALPDTVDAAAPKGNAFVAWLKGSGGISWSQKVDIVGERGVRGNYAGIFTKNGQNLDTLVESAVQAGYLTRADVENANDVGGTRALAELIRRATTGEKVPTVENAQAAKLQDGQARANMDAADYMERELQALGVDTTAARGNPEVLAAYLSDHREALVNSKLADIEAETKAERIQTGEAYNLTPLQIDQQARIALAKELDENAAYDAAMHARNETDYLNRIEEIIKNDPRSRTTPQGGARAQADGGIQARDGQASATGPAASVPTDHTLSAADRAIERDLAQFVTTKFDQATADYNARPDSMGGKVDAPKAANPLDARLADLEVRNPTALDAEIPIEFDSNGKPTSTMTAREYLEMVKKEASQDAADANLIEVAANCFLSGGI